MPVPNTQLTRPSRDGWLILQCTWGSGVSHCHTKKTWDENHFRTAQKTMDREPPSLQNKWQESISKTDNQANGNQVETWIQDCLHWVQWTLPTHWKSRYWKSKVMQCQRCTSQTTSGVLEHQHTIWQSWEIHQPPCKFANYHTQW